MQKYSIMIGLCAAMLLIPWNTVALDASDFGAHAIPLGSRESFDVLRSDPAPFDQIQSLPTNVRIEFSGRVDPVVSTIEVIDPEGVPRTIGSPSLDPTNAHIYQVGIHGRDTEGTYSVHWNILSADDGHVTEGSYTFILIHEKGLLHDTAGESVLSYRDGIFEGIAIGLELLGTALFTGILYAIVFLWRPIRTRATNIDTKDSEVSLHLLKAILFGALLIAIAHILYLLLKTEEIQLWQNVPYANTFGMFLGTVAGQGVLVRAGIAIVFIVICTLFISHIIQSAYPTGAETLLFVLLLSLAYARTDVSHIAATSFLPTFSMLVGTVHLFSKLILLGLTISLAWILLPILQSLHDTNDILKLLQLFTRHASIMIGTAALSGLYVIFILLRDPSNIFTTDWGIRFVILSTTAFVLLILRLKHSTFIQGVMSKKECEIQKALSHSLHYEALVDTFLTLFVGILIATATPLGPVHSSVGTFEALLIFSIIPILLLIEKLYRKAKKLTTLERP